MQDNATVRGIRYENVEFYKIIASSIEFPEVEKERWVRETRFVLAVLGGEVGLGRC